MNLDPTTTKYMIKSRIFTDGIVEKPDVVGAIFGQTEGLLGDDLDLRDLQKSGRVGRIEVNINSSKGKSEGEITIPSSLDQIETAILASALETIERVGPCKAKVEVAAVEDVRSERRKKIVERAKSILKSLIEESKSTSLSILDAVKEEVQEYEICYLEDNGHRLPAGPNVETSDAIIVVEGRNDVLNLLSNGIKNAVAVEGTNVPPLISKLASEKVVTAFVDGDRGGELILRELLEVAEVDYVARAPRGREVEEITGKQIMKILKNKIPAVQYMEMYGISLSGSDDKVVYSELNNEDNNSVKDKQMQNTTDNENAPKIPHNGKNSNHNSGNKKHSSNKRDNLKPEKVKSVEVEKEEPVPVTEEVSSVSDTDESTVENTKKIDEEFKPVMKAFDEIKGKKKAVFLSKDGNVVKTISSREVLSELKRTQKGSIWAVVFDGLINQSVMNVSAKKGVKVIQGTRRGAISKRPANLKVYTSEDLA